MHRGWMAYWVYRAVSYGVSPLVSLLLRCRRRRGLEHPVRWRERLGLPSAPRPHGLPLLWFHAVSLGEGLATIPLIRHCLHQQQQMQCSSPCMAPFTILMTTTTASSFDAIDAQLPGGVIHQFAPVDTPAAVDNFISYWKPSVILLMESELWPNLILSAVRQGIALALLNARMSSSSFNLWSGPLALPLISLMLSKFSLIASLSTSEAIRFQLLQAPPTIISFPGNLKYGNFDISEKEGEKVEELRLQLANRPVWMAASIHIGEEEVMLRVHKDLVKIYPDMVTIIVPRHPVHGRQIARTSQKEGFDAVLRSQCMKILHTTSIYIVDTLGELKSLYRLTPIAVVGGSFLPTLAGHNISEAAAMGCAVITGYHVGHFSHMIVEMLRLEPLSVWQVSGQTELSEAVKKLLGNKESLQAHQKAAKGAFAAVSSGVVERVWDLVEAHALKNVYLLTK